MSDIRVADQEYRFDDDIDEDKLIDIVVDAGIFFEDRYDPDFLSSDFHDANTFRTLNGKWLPHSSVFFGDSRKPGYKINSYSGEIDYNSQVEHIVDNNSVSLNVQTEVPNRQGDFSEMIHDDVVEDARESLEESVERHLDEQGKWA